MMVDDRAGRRRAAGAVSRGSLQCQAASEPLLLLLPLRSACVGRQRQNWRREQTLASDRLSVYKCGTSNVGCSVARISTFTRSWSAKALCLKKALLFLLQLLLPAWRSRLTRKLHWPTQPARTRYSSATQGNKTEKKHSERRVHSGKPAHRTVFVPAERNNG